MTSWDRFVDEYYANGIKCIFMDHDVEDMDKKELIACIGYLDEQFTAFMVNPSLMKKAQFIRGCQ